MGIILHVKLLSLVFQQFHGVLGSSLLRFLFAFTACGSRYHVADDKPYFKSFVMIRAPLTNNAILRSNFKVVPAYFLENCLEISGNKRFCSFFINERFKENFLYTRMHNRNRNPDIWPPKQLPGCWPRWNFSFCRRKFPLPFPEGENLPVGIFLPVLIGMLH